MKHSPSQIASVLEERGIPFPSGLPQKASRYLDQVSHHALSLDLVSKNDMHKLLARHFADSLSPIHHLDIPANAKILDLGSGGGFPAIPMKIARPDLAFTLYESTGKKSAFLTQIASDLAFADFTVVNHYLTHREKEPTGFNLCLARASCTLLQFARVCGFRLIPGGKLCTFKHKSSIQAELEGFTSSKFSRGLKLEPLIEYHLPNVSNSYVLVTASNEA